MKKIGFIGCGNMAGAIIGNYLVWSAEKRRNHGRRNF